MDVKFLPLETPTLIGEHTAPPAGVECSQWSGLHLTWHHSDLVPCIPLCWPTPFPKHTMQFLTLGLQLFLLKSGCLPRHFSFVKAHLQDALLCEAFPKRAPTMFSRLPQFTHLYHRCLHGHPSCARHRSGHRGYSSEQHRFKTSAFTELMFLWGSEAIKETSK